MNNDVVSYDGRRIDLLEVGERKALKGWVMDNVKKRVEQHTLEKSVTSV